MTASHYQNKYYFWQKSIGEFGGRANLAKFASYIHSDDKIIDFGCGGGFLLANIVCREKIGVDVNQAAIKAVKQKGMKAYRSLAQVSDNWADLVISNSALEHVDQPLREVQLIYRKLKSGGKAVFVVPCESVANSYFAKDINQHLYSWSPMNLGNLFYKAGFKIVEVKPYYHKWPPYYNLIRRLIGWELFDYVCRLYGFVNRKLVQVRIVARK